MAVMDAETIRSWIAQAEADLAKLTAEADQLQRRVAHARIQLELMFELLATVTNEPIKRDPDSPGSEVSVRERVAQAVVQILREHGQPMRVQDIHSEFLHRELPLPGSGTPANIAAHLVDRGLFTRPGRGIFGLVEWDSASLSAHSEASHKPPATRKKLRKT